MTAETSNPVSVIDARENRVVETFMVGAPKGHGVFAGRLARDVTAELGRTVSVVDTAAHRVIHTFRVPGTGAVKPMVSGDGRRVYVATGRGNTVVVFDAESYEVLATIPVGQRVWGLAVTPDSGARPGYTHTALQNRMGAADGREWARIRKGLQ